MFAGGPHHRREEDTTNESTKESMKAPNAKKQMVSIDFRAGLEIMER
jgi:hypothetical protein